MRLPPDVLVIGHRGSAGTAPENTLASFRRAAADGAAMIEFDVRMSRDGHLIVIHDRRLNRTTNGRGSVYRLDLEAIRSVDAGVMFGPEFRGERVPLLDEVFDAVPDSVGLNIEVKTEGDPFWRRTMAPAIAAAVGKRSGRRRILVSSFNHALLRQLHRLDPAIAIGVLSLPVRDSGKRPSALARTAGAATYICGNARLRRRLVDEAHRSNITVFVYGINTPAQMKRALAFGCDGVITDYPGRLGRLLPARSIPHPSP
jgi:glycerophosphoryl diester phosphodiesterase